MNDHDKEYVKIVDCSVLTEYKFKDGPRQGEISALCIGSKSTFTVPYSLIGDDSEVFGLGDRGSLVLERWKAEELGLVPSRKPGRRPLPKKGEREAAIILNVLDIIRDQAKHLRLAGAPASADAVCECGKCDASDPVGWHRVDFAAEELEMLANRIAKACS